MTEEEKNKLEDIFEQVDQKTPSFSAEQGINERTFQPVAVKPEIKKEVSSESLKVHRGKKRKIVSLVIIVLVLAIVVIFVFIFLKSRPLKSGENQESSLLLENGQSSESTSTPPVVEVEEQKVLDSDGDGLTDSEESILKTNKNIPDTDSDGLSDKEEVKVYKTNPLLNDSDGDGISDGEEIRQGNDPNNAEQGAKLLDLQKEIEKLK